jgi:archaellum component FlaF (FlaF/FlaG flagellin family)
MELRKIFLCAVGIGCGLLINQAAIADFDCEIVDISKPTQCSLDLGRFITRVEGTRTNYPTQIYILVNGKQVAVTSYRGSSGTNEIDIYRSHDLLVPCGTYTVSWKLKMSGSSTLKNISSEKYHCPKY